MPLPLRLVLGSLLVLVGLALLAVAVLGARSRLRRNAWAGVRTPASLRSDAAFTAANRVAAAPAGAAGTISAAGGAALLAGAAGALGWVLLTVSVLGMLVLAGIAGVVGDRAAAMETPELAGLPGCAGACAGCSLVEGCHPAGTPGSGEATRSDEAVQAEQLRYQPQEPSPPLNGPTTSSVTQPP